MQSAVSNLRLSAVMREDMVKMKSMRPAPLTDVDHSVVVRVKVCDDLYIVSIFLDRWPHTAEDAYVA